MTKINKQKIQTNKKERERELVPHLLQKSFDGLGGHLSTGYGLVNEQAHGQRDEELPCILLQDILERCGTLIIIMKGIVYECSVFILLQDILERCGTLIIIMKGIVYSAQSST